MTPWLCDGRAQRRYNRDDIGGATVSATIEPGTMLLPGTGIPGLLRLKRGKGFNSVKFDK